MQDWKEKLRNIPVSSANVQSIKLPNHFIFKNHGVYDFEPVLSFFDWTIENTQVEIDFRECVTANYQALTLVVLYCLRLKKQGCRISFKLNDKGKGGASEIWRTMGALGLFNVSTDHKTNFRHNENKPLIAIRNTHDFKKAIEAAEKYTSRFNVEYMDTLRHILSELLYNTLEHGVSFFNYRGTELPTPSLIQFAWYQGRNEIHFIIADTGVGIKKHLSQAYPGIETDVEAIKLAIKPQVSGTFGPQTNPYHAKNNAGVGLYLSTNIVRRLNADMHIMSGNGLLHVSPRDITSKQLLSFWPGTTILVSIKLSDDADFSLESMMQEFREAAREELERVKAMEIEKNFYIDVENHFGPYAEDKHAAIKFRDNKLLPEMRQGKNILIDFIRVKQSPHSFLSALLATPIKLLGLKAYKQIKIVNANSSIRGIIDYIFDENTEAD